MPRFKIADKKAIAKYQEQEVWEYDDWTDEPVRIVGYRCKICRRVFPLDILEVDHIRPQSRGGTNLPSNLRLLCPPCNKKKGGKVKRTATRPTVKSKLKKASGSRKVKGKARKGKASPRTLKGVR